MSSLTDGIRPSGRGRGRKLDKYFTSTIPRPMLVSSASKRSVGKDSMSTTKMETISIIYLGISSPRIPVAIQDITILEASGQCQLERELQRQIGVECGLRSHSSDCARLACSTGSGGKVATRSAHLRLLKPYLVGEGPREHNSEWDMFCPLHEDKTRSASLNIESSEWFCNAGCGGGSVVELILRQKEWVLPPSVATANGARRRSSGKPEELPGEAMIQGWMSSLLSNDDRLDWLTEKRMLNTDTIVSFGIGWNRDRKVYTIPIRGGAGELLNVRFYDPAPRNQARKIWGVTGHNQTRLFPLSALTSDDIILGEGEWDIILTTQMGYAAITPTGAATVWEAGWSPLFKGKHVFVVGDRDEDGVKGQDKRARALLPYVADLKIIELPYEVTAKHGKDLTDFWREFDRSDFEALLANASSLKKGQAADEPELITVLDSFDARRVGSQAKLLVTIKGKKEPGYTVPNIAALHCTKDAGDKCRYCTMNATEGDDEFAILPDNPIVLELMDSTIKQVHDVIRRAYGAQQCNRLTIEAKGHQAVEILFARPSIDHSDGSKAGDYKNIKITSVGHHDTMPNNTVMAIGALQPNPRTQSNEWLAHSILRQETSVDRFELTPEAIRLMKRFQTNGRPLAKLAEISRQLSAHVTRIYGRPEMHALIDLTFHSVLSWKFGGDLEHRGWLETLVLGDTRTGKSEAASKLVRHFGVGEVIGGESASVAGLLGGLQTFGSGKEWTVTWGAIPINHKRLVVIDEASGLSREDIAKLSDARSSGVVKIQKIQQDMTQAMTRLLWLSNPRDAKMSDFTYGVQALFQLIGNNEDIARFDLVMCVRLDDVAPEEINRPHEAGELHYTSEACNALVRWAWTRKPDQVLWTAGAEKAVYEGALALGRRYVEDPPLVQAANARVKIARLAVSLAARLFSTDDSHEKVVVKPEHVSDAIAFIDKIYGMPAMGYGERSKEILADREEALKHYDDIKIYLRSRPGLAKFLKGTGKYRRQDIEEVLNIDRSEANGVVNTLLNARMVRKDGADVRVEPTLHTLLREMR